MPIPHHIPCSYIKKAFLWSLYYLRNNFKFEKAIFDISKRGGDSRSNAATVGALIGARDGIIREQIEPFISKDLKQLLEVVSIVDDAP